MYNTERLIRIRFPDKTGDFVKINQTIIDTQTGESVVINDLSAGKYDIEVSTGATYNTRREEASDKLMNLSKVIPQVGQVAPDLIVENLDFPHSKELAKRLKHTIPPNVLGAEDIPPEEQQLMDQQQQAQQMQAQQEQQLQQMQLQVEQLKAQAEVEKAKAVTIKAQMDVEKEKADLATKQLEIEREKIRLEIEQMKLKGQRLDNAPVESYNGNMNEVIREQVADAIAEFETALITPNAPFDRYLRGDKQAISQEAQEGYRLFEAKGCVICHHGVNIGGNFYNKFGIYKDANSHDLGRYNITKREEDKYVFKVPSLRNISLTSPYMHDGRFDTLHDAVEFMTEHQLGRFMKSEEIDAIVAFLKSLTGEIPEIVKLK